MIRFKWIGVEEFQKKLLEQPDKLLNAVKGAIYEEAETIMTQAKLITPVDEGTLRGSGHVDLPVQDGDKISVSFGFGGPAGTGNINDETNKKDVGYAVYVHEDLTANHVVGQAKFLETPLTEARKSMADDLAKKINGRLKK